MPLNKTFVFIAFAFVTTSIFAQGANHIKIRKISQTVEFREDFSSTTEAFVDREALTEQGAIVAGKHSQTIISSLGKYEILDAYTLKPDGYKLPVPIENIQIQKGIAAHGTGQSRPDADVYLITFPDLKKGDRSIIKYRLTQYYPALPKWASFHDVLEPGVAFDEVNVLVKAPSTMQIAVSGRGSNPIKTVDGGSDIWSFSTSQPTPKRTESNVANGLIDYPHIMASTLKNHEEVVQAYAVQSDAELAITPEIETLAKQITEGSKSPKEKASALHDWVRNNIRYVAQYLHTGGWKPHSLDWILKNRYGDCKDHVLLLQALFKASGIESVPALVSLFNEYSLPEAPTVYSFNHVILYLPELDIFTDPTSSQIPFGALPWAAAGKPAAVALRTGAKILSTPYFFPENNQLFVKTRMAVSKQGQGMGNVEVAAHGHAATLLQDRLEQIPSGMGASAVQKMLEGTKLQGRGFAQYPAVQRQRQDQALHVNDLEIDNLLSDASAGALNPHPYLGAPVYIKDHLGSHTAPSRDYAYPCAPVQIREEFELEFDPAFQLTRVPADFRESHPDGILFEAHYAKENNTVKGWRQLTLSHPRHVCSSADYAARKPSLDRIAQHLRGAVLYQQ